MAINISTYLDRIKLQLEAISLEPLDNNNIPVVFKRGMVNRDTYPFYTMELLSVRPTKMNFNMWRYDVTITIRLFRGVVNEGYDTDGNIESVAQDDCFAVLEYFHQYPDLTTAALTTSIAGFVPGSAAIASQGVGNFNGQMVSQYQLTFSILETK